MCHKLFFYHSSANTMYLEVSGHVVIITCGSVRPSFPRMQYTAFRNSRRCYIFFGFCSSPRPHFVLISKEMSFLVKRIVFTGDFAMQSVNSQKHRTKMGKNARLLCFRMFPPPGPSPPQTASECWLNRE
jgi:hypothetical protein